MTTHELAKALLEQPNIPVHSEPNGYDSDMCPEVNNIEVVELDKDDETIWGIAVPVKKVLLLKA